MSDANPSPQISPPKTEQELLDWLRLIRSRRVGPATFFRLMAEHGSAEQSLAELPSIAAAAGVSDYEPCSESQAEAEIRNGRLAGAALVALGDPRYPPLLAEIPDAPPLFWALGRIEVLREPMVSIVGARNASSLGLRMARALSEGLSKAGNLIVSGMARGIDTAAHEAAHAKCSLAVFAGGVDVVYPGENAVLAQEIQECGLRISEMPPGTVPQSRHFVQRNRIISGLSRALVVVEAAARSGSLITARNAAEQGREVMAVPGHPFDARSAGCNFLIRDGATLVRGAQDVIDALSPVGNRSEPAVAAPTVRHHMAPPTAPATQTNLDKDILGLLATSSVPEDKIVQELKQSVSAVSEAILGLEMLGHVVRRPDGTVARV